jgi:colanic acid/amylovoran biosynthesis glycosyltransferase
MTKPATKKPLSKICYLLKSFPEISETFIVEEMQSMMDAGIAVDAIAIYQGNFDLQHPIAESFLKTVAVSYVKPVAYPQMLSCLAQLLVKKPGRCFKTLVKALQSSKERWRYFIMLPYAVSVLTQGVDYLHAHFADENLQLAEVLSEWTGIPYGFTAHRYDIFEAVLEQLSELANKAAAVVTVSEFNKRFMVANYAIAPEKIYVAYNGIRTELFQPNRQAANNACLNLVNVGRLVAIKGQDILLAAVHLVRTQGYEVQLRIIGEGLLQADLEAQIAQLALQDCVTLMGAQSQSQVCHYLDAADVFVMPSRSEGFAVACLEAMAMKLPVIASNVTGFPEAVSDYETGILVEVENPALLAEAIIWMIKHPEQRLEMGKKARDIVETKFTRTQVTNGLINYWEQSIQNEGLL